MNARLGSCVRAVLCAALASCARPTSQPAATPTQAIDRSEAFPDAGIASADPLGPRPSTTESAPFLPPTPVVFRGPNGVAVWLIERHSAPLISCDLALPWGAAADPVGKAGLAYVTARMLTEGAGDRGAIELSRAIGDLGAKLETNVDDDGSFVSLTALKRNLRKAMALFSDVVVRPRLDGGEFARLKDLWTSELEEKKKDADATASVVFRAALFGSGHPYGHPPDGLPETAKTIGIADVRSAYAANFRADEATLVCAGDLTQADLQELLQASLGPWRSSGSPPRPVAPEPPRGPWPRLVLVDRPGAPQSVVAAVRLGVAASDPAEPILWRVNDAIGGSFTSRLNQDLRERRGITYGARSSYWVTRGPGELSASADVVSDKTAEALDALVGDLETFARSGLTSDETARTRSQSRAHLIGIYESVEAIAQHLAENAALGLPPEWDVRASDARDAASKRELDALASRFYDPKDAVLVVVGPRASIQPMLEKRGVPIDFRDSEGRPLR